MNAKLRVTVKSVLSISLLEKLSKKLTKFQNGITYRALFLVAYFGFFRLASLVPNSMKSFDKTRYPVFRDIVWGSPGASFDGDYQVVQLPKLDNYHICPVTALKAMIAKFNYTKETPLFLIQNKAAIETTVAFKVRFF